MAFAVRNLLVYTAVVLVTLTCVQAVGPDTCKEKKCDSGQECRDTDSGATCVKLDTCELPKDVGSCKEKKKIQKRFYYDSATEQCTPFNYSGDGGNGNNFANEIDCEVACGKPKMTKPGNCKRVLSSGFCINRCSFDHSCPGSKKCCKTACGGRICDEPFGQISSCGKPPPGTKCVYGTSGPKYVPINVCELPKVVGPCEATQKRFYYDSATEECTPFNSSGCGGNANSFEVEIDCELTCEKPKVFKPGKCPWFKSYGQNCHVSCSFDHSCPSNHKCCPTACGGSVCKYPDRSKNCDETRCSVGTECVDTSNGPNCVPINKSGECPKPGPKDVGICSLTCVDDRDCQGNQKCCKTACGGTVCTDPVEPARVTCASKTCPIGTTCTESVEGAKCITTIRCEQPKERGRPCQEESKEKVRRFYFDPRRKQCRSFMFWGCDGNQNNFMTKRECEVTCQQEICLLPKDPGPCGNRRAVPYYDASTGRCQHFWYGGCMGNANRFYSYQECRARCQRRLHCPTDSGPLGPWRSECSKKKPCKPGLGCCKTSSGRRCLKLVWETSISWH